MEPAEIDRRPFRDGQVPIDLAIEQVSTT
jgi:hypothetical protein